MKKRPVKAARKRPSVKTRTGPGRRPKGRTSTRSLDAVPVSARELRALRHELERRTAPARWNPDPKDVQKSVAQLVLTIVEFLRKLMERQAIRRMEARTLTPKEVEAVGQALMLLEQTIREIGKKWDPLESTCRHASLSIL